ncbi:MAG: aliphatic sulfonate ABC transporter substrate-binding protein [Tistlia sp.]|uniref:aliphatic sulfonate ABC transporter substrate-binding protein n=1 Tax=Tistlia sp. TaxID=3057121 RepID=UPI0034A503D5
MTASRRSVLSLAAAAAFGLAAGSLPGSHGPAQAADLDRVTLDYAYYNPVALLIKDQGWVEEEFAKDDIDVRWVLSLGSNKALEYLRGGSVDFGSTAGAAAVVGRANGLPIQSVYIYSKPEWTALVTQPDSGIAKVEDLAGKRVAVTRGTDPHIFLLRALADAGLGEKDIETVLLQHPDGYTALARGQVDAWAGLDPHMAKAELESGSVLFYRNPDYNTYGVLNVREDFAAEHPEIVRRVLALYERGRKHALEHPEELRRVLVEATRISEAVADKQLLERTDLSNPVIGPVHREAFVAAGRTLLDIGVLPEGTDVEAVVGGVIEPAYIETLASH